jgi:hypothetical protein
MNARTKLRALIDELEARYAVLDEETDSYDETRSANFRSVNQYEANSSYPYGNVTHSAM